MFIWKIYMVGKVGSSGLFISTENVAKKIEQLLAF
jgi:hypothetical protein